MFQLRWLYTVCLLLFSCCQLLPKHCSPPHSVVRVTLYSMNNCWIPWRWSSNSYLLLAVTKHSQHARKFFAATHLPPQTTTRSRLPMTQWCSSTVTWKGPGTSCGGLDEGGPPQHDWPVLPTSRSTHTANNKRLCFRSTTTSGCHAMMLFESTGHPYSQV